MGQKTVTIKKKKDHQDEEYSEIVEDFEKSLEDLKAGRVERVAQKPCEVFEDYKKSMEDLVAGRIRRRA